MVLGMDRFVSPHVKFVVHTTWLLVGPVWVTLAAAGSMPAWTGFPFLAALGVALYYPALPGCGDRILNVALTLAGLFVGVVVSGAGAVSTPVPWLDLAMSRPWSLSLVWSMVLLLPMHVLAELLDL